MCIKSCECLINSTFCVFINFRLMFDSEESKLRTKKKGNKISIKKLYQSLNTRIKKVFLCDVSFHKSEEIEEIVTMK